MAAISRMLETVAYSTDILSRLGRSSIMAQPYLHQRLRAAARSVLTARNFPHHLTNTAWHDWYPFTNF